MKRKILKLLPIALAVFALSGGYAKDEQMAKGKTTYDQGYEATKADMVAAYNAPARYDLVNEMDFYFQVGFIYWQAVEQGLEYALRIPGSYDAAWTTPAKVENMDFNFKPGLKLGMGLAFNQHDDWMMSAEYTYLVVRDRSTAYPPVGGSLIEMWDPTDPTAAECSKATARWRVYYNMLDLGLSRPYYLGTKLIFKPYAGLKGGWITQKVDASYYFSTEHYYPLYPSLKQKSWMIGPKAALNADWMLGKGFKLYGNLAGSLLYQNFKTRYLTTDITSETSSTFQTFRNEVGYVTPNAEIGLGFGWGSYFADKGWNFDFRFGYDFQIYWTQNMMRNLVQIANDVESTGGYGNLVLNGLTMTARFDF